MESTTGTTRVSRAVRCLIKPGNSGTCVGCDQAVNFRARLKLEQVICNIYVDGKWDHVEYFHLECYDDRYGPPTTKVEQRDGKRAAQ